MLIARWLILLMGLTVCVSAALYLVTRKPVFWLVARRTFILGVAAALVFFGVEILERLAVL
ncbi:MAG TPA: hypothetical protein VH105_16130 [Burkholderiales bacterium]|nr:hypothetical protein [Burkholderiales bacterium]